MAVVKAISTQELAALANRLRLTLIRDRMEEMLTMAVDKKLSPRETLEFFFVKKFGVEKKIVSDKASWELIFLQYGRWKILILRLNHQLM